MNTKKFIEDNFLCPKSFNKYTVANPSIETLYRLKEVVNKDIEQYISELSKKNRDNQKVLLTGKAVDAIEAAKELEESLKPMVKEVPKIKMDKDILDQETRRALRDMQKAAEQFYMQFKNTNLNK